ncbi:MAG: hypothetical protein ACR2RL_22085, partial [Gammaproteobacteria bacterium]
MSQDDYDDPFGLRGGFGSPPLVDDSERTVLIPTPGRRSSGRRAPSVPLPSEPPPLIPETYAPSAVGGVPGPTLGAGGLGPPAFAAGGVNPLLDAAAPLLALLIKLRTTPSHADPSALRSRVAEQV